MSPRAPCKRRLALKTGAASLAVLAFPALASSRRALPALTEGPFYPSPDFRKRKLDWDADLTRVAGPGTTAPARGEYLDLYGIVSDDGGRIIDGAELEIWQCDVFGSYRHPRGASERVDDGFQGFGSTRTDAHGIYRFRTIRPVPYPGRTPHIHLKVRHSTFGELTSQLFVAGDAGNARDFLYRRLSDDERAQAELSLQRAPSGSGVTWVAERSFTVGG